MTFFIPQIFSKGYRLFRGEDLNNAIASSVLSSQAGIVANATTQALGTPLVAGINEIDTSVANGVVLLPVSKAGSNILVINNTANSIIVMGALADTTVTMNGTIGTTGLALAAGKVCEFDCAIAGKWFRILSA